jgi:signal transduction histidine kinase
MRRFRDLPLQRKVTRLILIASLVSLAIAAGGVVLYDLTTLRPRALSDLVAQADLIRFNTTAALVFGDRESATENLATLKARPEVAQAVIFTIQGERFAWYNRDGSGPPSLLPPQVETTIVEGNHPTVVQSMANEDGPQGWLIVRSDLPPILSRLPQYGLLVVVVLLAVLTLSLLLSRFLRKSITTPIGELADTSRTISSERNYQIRAVKHGQDELGSLTDAFNQMLETIQARDAALQETSIRLHQTMVAARMGFWSWDPANDRLLLDDQARAILAPAAPLDESVAAFVELIHPDDRQHVLDALQQSVKDMKGIDIDVRKLTGDPAGHWLALRGRAHGPEQAPGVDGLIVDVNEKRRLEEQLAQSQKMEAIGRLAGGIAHDFNNLLTAILGYARFAARSLPDNSPAKNDVMEIERAGQRAASLTSQLLAYARRQITAPKPANLNNLILGVQPMLQRLIGEHIRLHANVALDLWPARLDSGQFEQVILNLVVNARDAMPEGGDLLITTLNLAVIPGIQPPHPDLPPGEFVLLEVRDNGIGMNSATVERVFEPFFTTKEPGRGTGLGLAVCYGIVKQAGGYIWAESVEGQGSTFSVLLPAAPGESAVEPVAEPLPLAEVSSGETVLVAEDEELVRALAVRSLDAAGYRVLQARDGEGALELARSFDGEIDVLLTDVLMPGMNGPDLATRLWRSRPGTAVVFMSGYADRTVVPESLLLRGIQLVAKPFDPSVLVGAVRKALTS